MFIIYYLPRFPDYSVYKFAEHDSANNIVFEEREKSSGVPLIKVIIFLFFISFKF